MEEIGVGPLPAPSHPAPDLVQLTEAEHVGPVHDERVHRGHVDARFDDGRADQHVVTPLPEVEHDRLEAALVHLPVGDGHLGLGHQVSDVAGHPLDVRNPVVDVEGLALAQQLPPQRLADRRGVLLAHVREDGAAIGRRGVDHREVADPRECHLERARDRTGGQRQDVDAFGHALDCFLVRDPEALLLVDHQQAEPFELDVLGQQAVRADHDVDTPVGQARHHLALLRR